MGKSALELRVEYEQENLISLSEEEERVRDNAAKQADLAFKEASSYMSIDEENPASFLKPDTLFAQALDYMFDPYGTGHVTLEGIQKVCNYIGLIRQLVRMRIRLQFMRKDQFKEVDNAARHRYLSGTSKSREMSRFLDITPLVFYCEQWFKEYADGSSTELASAGTKESWVKFEDTVTDHDTQSTPISGGLLACCEGYIMAASTGYRNIPQPPQSILPCP